MEIVFRKHPGDKKIIQGFVFLKSKNIYFDSYYIRYNGGSIIFKPETWKAQTLYSSELNLYIHTRSWWWGFPTYHPSNIYHYHVIITSSMEKLFKSIDIRRINL